MCSCPAQVALCVRSALLREQVRAGFELWCIVFSLLARECANDTAEAATIQVTARWVVQLGVCEQACKRIRPSLSPSRLPSSPVTCPSRKATAAMSVLPATLLVMMTPCFRRVGAPGRRAPAAYACVYVTFGRKPVRREDSSAICLRESATPPV